MKLCITNFYILYLLIALNNLLEYIKSTKFHAKYHLDRMIISNGHNILFGVTLRKYRLLADDTKNVSKGKELSGTSPFAAKRVVHFL